MLIFRTAFIALFLGSMSTFAASGITYHGRIVKPDNTPLESATTRFRIQIKAPDAGNCVLWEEEQTRNMLGSNGAFSITIGDSTDTTISYSRIDTYGWSMERVFSNRLQFSSLTGCAVGNNYIPNAADGRILEVSFKEAATDPIWEAFPATKVNLIPMSLNSLQLEGFRADEFLKIDPYTNQTPISNAGVNTLLSLIAGTSNLYVKPADPLGGDLTGTIGAGTVVGLRGRALGAAVPAVGQVLKFDGTSWVPSADDTGATPADASYLAKGVVQINTDQATSGLFIAGGVLALPNVITAGGPVGGASTVPVITYDQKGRLTAVTTATVDDTTKLPLAGGTMTGPINMGTQNITNATSIAAANFSGRSLIFNDNDTNTATIRTPADITANYVLELPANDGGSGEVLTSNGSGVLSWTAPASGISVTANQAVIANGTGTGLTNFTCPINQAFSFDGAGLPTCLAVTPAGGFINGGNSFGAAATLGTNDNFDLNFETNGTTKMTVLANGNVGIGITTPQSQLDIAIPTTDTTNNAELILSTHAGTYREPAIHLLGSRPNFTSKYGDTGVEGWRIASTSGNGGTGGYENDFKICNRNGTAGENCYYQIDSGSGNMNLGGINASTHLGSKVNVQGNMTVGTTWSSFSTQQAAPSNSLIVEGMIGAGIAAPSSVLDVNGAITQRGMAAPAVSPAGQGRIYFDSTSNTFRVSQNGGAYSDLVGTGGLTGSGTTGRIPVFTGATAVGDSIIRESASKIGIGGAPVGANVLSVIGGDASINGQTVGLGSGQVASNLAVGNQALLNNTTGGDSVAIGPLALSSQTTGYANVAVGGGALSGITTQFENVAVGIAAGGSLSSGRNTAVGALSLANATSGGGNTSVGTRSLYDLTTGAGNTVLGDWSGATMTTGSNNVVIGRFVSSTTLTTGSDNILIGGSASVDTPAAGTSNFLNIGNTIFATSTNTGTVAAPAGSVGIGTTSPGAMLQLGTAGSSLGTMRLTGNTSGYVQIQPAASAGSWTMTLPPDDGTSGQVLSTNGSGVTSWTTPATGTGDILNGGNTFGAAMTIGTNDNQSLNFESNGVTAMTMTPLGLGIGTSPATPGLTIANTGTEQIRLTSTFSGGGLGLENAGGVKYLIQTSGPVSNPADILSIRYHSAGFTEGISMNQSHQVGIGANFFGSAKLNLGGDIRFLGMAAPAVSGAGEGRIYFDSTSNLFRVSQNGGAYTNLLTSMSGFNANQAIVANGSGVASSFTCSVGQVLGFDASGFAVCSNVTGTGGFLNAGNSFAANATLGTNDNFGLNFETNGTTRMTILNDGSVGIGTTPTSRLHTSQTISTISGETSMVNNVVTFSPSAPTATSDGGTGVRNYVTFSGANTFNNWFNYGSKTVALSAVTTPAVMGNLTALAGHADLANSGTTNHLTGVEGYAYKANVGDVVRMYGVRGVTDTINASGTVNYSYGVHARVANSGTTTNAYGVYVDSVAGTNKWSFYANDATAPSYFAGDVGIGATAPGAKLQIGTAGTSLGTMRLTGNTSGYVQIQPAAAAGSWTMTLPATDGNNGEVLTTDGSGVLSWAAAGGATTLNGLTDVVTDYGAPNNMYLGSGVGATTTSGASNTALGTLSLPSITTANNTVAVGSESLFSLTTGSSNVAVGRESMYSTTTGSQNTAVGMYVLAANTTGGSNVAIGDAALSGANANDNTAVGSAALGGTLTGGSNVALGSRAGVKATGASSGNVFLGNMAGPSSNTTVTDTLWISNYEGTPLIYGDFFNGRVGIATTSPGAMFQLGTAGTSLGTMRLTGNTSGYVQIQPAAAAGSWNMTLPANDGDPGQVLTTNGSGVTSWATASSGATASGTAGHIQYSDGASGLSSDTNQFFWDATNNRLGIGTSLPTTSLTVNGGALFADPLTSSASGSYSVAIGNFVNANGNSSLAVGGGSVASGDESVAMGATCATYGTSAMAFGSGCAASGDSSVVLGVAQTGSAFAGSGGNYSVAIGAGNPSGARPYVSGNGSVGIFLGDQSGVTVTTDNVMSIMGGNVGIGSTAPGARLQLGTAGTSLGTMRMTGNTSGFVQIQPAAAAGSWTMTLPTTDGNSGQALTTDGAGVTTWTTVPANGGTFLAGNGSNIAPSISFSNDTGNDTGFFLAAENEIGISVNGINNGFITNDQWDIYRKIWASNCDALTPCFAFGADTDTGIYSAGTNILGFATGGAERVRISAGGELSIGNSSTAHALNVTGSAGLSTGTAWTNTSDRRLKDIHGDYEYGLNEILKLNTVRFNYKKNNPLSLNSEVPMTGFVAQEVQKVIPDAVTVRKDGYLELNVDPIHWATVNAVQDLYGMCKGSSQEIQQIKAENSELKKKIEQLEKNQNETSKLLLELQKRLPASGQ